MIQATPRFSASLSKVLLIPRILPRPSATVQHYCLDRFFAFSLFPAEDNADIARIWRTGQHALAESHMLCPWCVIQQYSSPIFL